MVPVFYSVGNHERKYRHRENYMQQVAESKAMLLDNESAGFHGVRIGGLSSSRTKVPDLRGRGLYAPGQGLLPKLTHGLHDGGRMLISRGMTNGAKPRIPRINNPCELIILNLERTEE